MEKNCVIKSSIFVLFTEFFSDEQTKENEVDGAFSTYGRDEKYMENFGQEM